MPKILKSSSYFPLQVTIDDREPGVLEREFRELGNMIIHRKRLEVGDFLLDGDFLVERKSIPDFCVSVKDGRLFTQAGKLVNSRIPACLILEGKNREFRKTDFSPKAIQGIMLSISLAFKLPILRTKSTHESVEVMLQGYKQLTRDKLEDQRFYPRPFPSKLKRDPLLAQKLHILEGFPGIGVDKAERLLTKFGSLQAIFSASSDVLLETPGIGKKTAEGMLEILKK